MILMIMVMMMDDDDDEDDNDDDDGNDDVVVVMMMMMMTMRKAHLWIRNSPYESSTSHPVLAFPVLRMFPHINVHTV